MDNPVVSFVVVVYNTEKSLSRCMDSLVFQSFQNIEIIVVNDGSIDLSQKIIEDYIQKFPDIIVSIQQKNGGVSSARKAGVEAARGTWIMFVDSDDWVHPFAAEYMMRKQVAEASDFVYATYANVCDMSTAVKAQGTINALPEDGSATVGAILKEGNNSFWGKLWNREFLMKNAQFYNMWHEDDAEVPALISKQKKVSYVKKVLYYHQIHKAEDSSTAIADRDKRLDLFKADERCYRNLNPEYEREYKINLAKRLVYNLQYLDIYDKSVAYAQEAWKKYGLDAIWEELPEETQDVLSQILTLGRPVIPELVYINDFDETYRNCYDTDIERAFCTIQEVIPLNKETCADEFDTLAERLCQNRRWDELGTYIACKKIYQKGGVYIAPEIQIVKPLDKLKFDTAFFCQGSKQHVTTAFFGGMPGADVFGEILSLWQVREDKDTAGQIIESILTGFCGIYFDNCETYGIHREHLYPMDWLFFDFAIGQGHVKRRSKDMYELPLEVFVQGEEERQQIKVQNEALNATKERLIQERRELRQEIKELKAERKQLIGENKQLVGENRQLVREHKNQIKELQKKISTMKQTTSWKVTKPLRFIGRLIKKVRSVLK